MRIGKQSCRSMESGRISIGKSAAVDLKQTHRKDAEGAAYHHTDQKQDPRIHLFSPFLFFAIFRKSPDGVAVGKRFLCRIAEEIIRIGFRASDIHPATGTRECLLQRLTTCS